MGEFILLLDLISVWDEEPFPTSTVTLCLTAVRSWWSTKVQRTREREKEGVHPYNMFYKAVTSLPSPNQHKTWQHIGHMFLCKGCGKKFKTNRHKKLVCGRPRHRKRFFNFSMWGNDHCQGDHPQSKHDLGGGEEQNGSGHRIKGALNGTKNN